MILVRSIFQAKFGRGDELVALIKEAKQLEGFAANRILTDLSGPFFTVVAETEVESLAAWEAYIASAFNMPEFEDWFARVMEVVESGRREFYNIET